MHGNEVKDLGNINKGLYPPSKMINNLGVIRLKLIGFWKITDEDVYHYRSRYKNKVRKLNDNLNERSKAIKSSSTTDVEAIELMEITYKI